MTRSFYFEKKKKEEEPLYSLACNTIIIIKHILMECADLVEVMERNSLRRDLFVFTFSKSKPREKKLLPERD